MSQARSKYPVDRLIQPLRQKLGRRFVLDQPEELLVYECDACTLIKTRPDLVVLPATTEEVALTVQLCHQYQIPFVARGAGTGLSGGALPVEGGVIISLSRMNRIRELDIENRTAMVEPGVVNAWLNRELAPHGLFYAPDPSSQSACTIGGNIAENAGGIHCIKYGVTTDHVLALEVVLPDGSVVWVGSKTRRAHGLNLVGVMVGSEGTLGIVTQAIVRLTPVPQTIRVFLAAFDQVAQATDTVATLIQSELTPSALEFMDAFTVKAVNEAFQVGFPEQCEAVLLIELDGPHWQVNQVEQRLRQILEQHEVIQVQVGETEQERQALWAARKGAVAAYGRYQPAFYLHDCVIPRSELTYVLRRIHEIGAEYRMLIGNVFHAGDGNLHPNILFDPDDAEMVQRVLAGGYEILNVCLEVGGTLSGEHGIGIEKSAFMDRIFSEDDLTRMKRFKALFDPKNLANPAKIFPIRKGCGETHTALTHTMKAGEGLWI